MKTASLFTIIGISLFASSGIVHGAGYDTLPKHVNTFVFKQMMSGKIESEYNARGEKETLDLKEEFTSKRLEDVSEVIKAYFGQLKSISPEAYNDFSLGEFAADVEADVSAQGFGYGFGINDRLTVYGSLPVYHIKSDVRVRQTKPGNISQIQQNVQGASTDSAIQKFVKDLTLQLPSANTELLQSLVVNYYGYKPVGKWEKDALGDAEIGFIYRLTDFSDKGVALSAGAVLPTGSTDDPDSLQDIPTGDGQYDAFMEMNSGISFLDNTFQFDLKGRYTYQFASDKEVRSIDDPALKLSKNKEVVKEKLGNKIDAAFTFTVNPTHWVSLHSALLYAATEKSTYTNTSNARVKNALEDNTSSVARWLKVGVGFSTVEAYKRKHFDMPFEIGVSGQRLLNAKNTKNYDRVDLDLKLYF